MLPFDFCSPTRVVLEKDAELKAGKLIKEYGGSRVLIHYGGKHAKKSGLIDRVADSVRAEGLEVFELGGEYDVTHGAGLAVVIPAWMRYVWRKSPVYFIKWATRVMDVPTDFGTDEEIIEEAICRLEAYYRSMDLAVKLSEMPEIKEEVTEEAMYTMAKRVRITNDDGTVGGFMRLGTEDIVKIFKLAL